jgi:hypothetical protein
VPFTKEDVEVLAFKRYKSNEIYEDSIWYLAELCVTINKNVIDGYDIKPLETDNLVLMLRPDVNGQIITANEDEIKDIAEIIYGELPSRAQIHWFIAEKTLVLKEIEKIISSRHA